MRRLILCLALLMVISAVPMAMADNDRHDHGFRVRTHLSGFNEVHFAAGGGTPTTLSRVAWRCLHEGEWQVRGQDR